MNKTLTLLVIKLFCLTLHSQTVVMPSSYRFIVLGDRSGGPQPGVFPSVIKKTLSLSPHPVFYINVGDLIRGYTSDTIELKKQWEEVLAELTPITEKYRFHFVPGNHDITDSLQLPLYMRHAGKTYYSFNVGSDHFVVLDNSRGDGLLVAPAEQLAWLKQDLATAKKARYTFCIYHMPRWSLDPGEKTLDTLHRIFKEGSVDYVINGHYHGYQYGERDGIKYIVLGSSGGASNLVKTAGTVYQFLVADISPENVNIRPFLLDGDTMRIDWIGKNKLSLVRALEAPFWASDSGSKTCTFSMTTDNLISQPISTRLFFEMPDSCKGPIKPDTLLGQVQPFGKKTFTFSASTKSMASCAILHAEYRWPGDSLILKTTPEFRRQIELAPFIGKITIDGELDEKVWTTLLNKPDNRFGNNEMVDDSSWIGLAYDKNNLYLAYLCWEQGLSSVTTISSAEKRDILSPKETQIRFYLGYQTANDSFFQIQMNVPGSLLDMKVKEDDGNWINDKTWDGVSAWKVKMLKDRWQGEITIPWKAMGVASPEALRFNCRRTSKRETSYQVPYERNPKRFAMSIIKK